MVSAKGNRIANQFKIQTKDRIFFQSYNSIIASITKGGKIELYKDWDYSNTTRKYLYQFLWDWGYRNLYNKKQVEAAIKSGDIAYKEIAPNI